MSELDDARAALDRVLAARPAKSGHDFAAALAALSQYRERARKSGDGDTLRRVNMALSAIYAGQYPLGTVPWRYVEQARDIVSRLVDAR